VGDVLDGAPDTPGPCSLWANILGVSRLPGA
jgi:hypothetical protein